MNITKKFSIYRFNSCRIASCDSTIAPFVVGKAPYSVYGYLEAERDANFVRAVDRLQCFDP